MFGLKCAMFLCVNLFVLGAIAGPVSFIDPCHREDDDCILKSAIKALPYIVKGVPDIGIPSMDPLAIKDINADKGELKFKLKNLIVKELSKCNLIKVVRPEKLKTVIELECPIIINGQYTLDGNIFALQVFGEGDTVISTKNIKLIVTIKFKEIEKNGEKHYKITSFDYKYIPIEQFDFAFSNLYNGDKDKAETLNVFLKENWKEILGEVGPSIIKKILSVIVHGIDKLFLEMPANQLELE